MLPVQQQNKFKFFIINSKNHYNKSEFCKFRFKVIKVLALSESSSVARIQAVSYWILGSKLYVENGIQDQGYVGNGIIG